MKYIKKIKFKKKEKKDGGKKKIKTIMKKIIYK